MRIMVLVAAAQVAVAAGIAALWWYTDHRTRQRINRLRDEDRAVADLDAIWELPAFDPGRTA